MECMKSELDIFARKPAQLNILKTEEVAYKPVSSLDNTSDIEFLSLGHGDTYRDLSSIYLRLHVQILKDTKGTVHEDAKTGVVNNILHLLFRQCSIYLNNKPIAQTDNNYNYRCYIENLLNYGTETASTHLDGVGWTLDKGKIDSIVDKENTGLDTRKALFGKCGVVELMGKIHADMFNQHKLLMNNVDLRVVLSLEKPEFYIMEADTGTSFVKFLDATLYVNHVTVSPPVHQNVLQRRNAVYPYKRVEVKSYTVSPNSFNLSLDNVIIGQLPNLLIFGMVDNDAYSGKRSKNPFNFQHYNISQFNLSVNGAQIPAQPLQFDYTKTPPVSAREYNTLFTGTNIHHFDKAHQITNMGKF